ncbi:MAG: hypothetical protein SFU56_12550 [Capsulimonadales bacterium]|nr:hypothetical protein [Capsulimonadales bacterium]
MAATAGRAICPRCGANNFSTQAACWKCGTSLTGAGAAPRPPASAPPSVAPAGPANPAPTPVPYAATADAPDPAVALWAAVALALLFPFVAVPVGIVFLMLDDRRKAELGRATILWGVISSVAHLLVTGWLINATVRQGMAVLQGITRARAEAAGGTLGSGDLNLPGRPAGPATNGSRPPVPFVPNFENVPFPDPPSSTP